MRTGVAGVRYRIPVTSLAVALLAALPYLVRGGLSTFIAFDDDKYVLANPAVLQGLTGDGVRWAFTAFLAGNWHPLTWISHMLDVQLFGAYAWGHHLTSILLHALNAALLFLALYRLTGAHWRSALVAALFGVHPLRVESVAWIAERKDVLAGLFFMLVLLAYERAARRGAGARSPAVLALFALGLLAKPMLVTLPVLLLLLDVWPLGRAGHLLPSGAASRPSAWKGLIAEKGLLLALACASAVVTLLAQMSAGAVLQAAIVPLGLRMQNALASVGIYLAHTVGPSGLAIFYPYPAQSLPWWKAGGAAAALLTATAAAIVLARRLPFLAAGWFWFLGMLVPVLGLVQVGTQASADRYTYLPQIGLLLAAAWGAAAVLADDRTIGLATLGAAAAVAVFSAATVAQVGHWRDSESLFRHSLAMTSGGRGERDSHGWMLHNNLGVALRSQGRNEEAAAEFREALRLNPWYALARNNLGNALAALGRFPEAESEYRRAILIDPGYAHAHNNLGNALAAQARMHEAEAAYREALRLLPSHPEARLSLGRALAASVRPAEALAVLREAARLRPDDPAVHEALAEVCSGLGMPAEAVAHREDARRLRERGRL